MDLELRPITEDEVTAYVLAVGVQFGQHRTERDVASARDRLDLDRTLAVFDGDEVVATAAAWTFDMTVPGGAALATAGVTFVGVRPTHRRRGLLRRMMARQLDDVAARGEPLAALTSSEAPIYGRFGYGVAAFEHGWSLRRDGTTLLRPSSATGGVRMIGADEARVQLPDVYARSIRRIPGAVTRSDGWWRRWFDDPEHERGGGTALFFAVHDAGGYVAWRRIGSDVLVVRELQAVDDEVEAALWQLVLDVDLVQEIRAARRPVDERLPWRLVDRRRLVTENVGDDLYVRLVDPGAALAGRTYGVEGELVLDLHDPFRPTSTGRWLLTGGPDGASCARTTRDADLALAAPELGSVYLGGVSPTSLARAGRIEEVRPGALRRADLLFASPVAPWLTMHF